MLEVQLQWRAKRDEEAELLQGREAQHPTDTISPVRLGKEVT